MAAMLTRRIAASLACALLLGAPAAALAQSAGDQQYFDPVGPDDGGSGNSGSTGSTPSPAPAPAPAPSTGTSAAAPAPTTTATPAAAAEGTPAAPGELPRTGGDPLIIAVFGVAMLLTGAGTRLLVVREPF
jgi:hypothetical protein